MGRLDRWCLDLTLTECLATDQSPISRHWHVHLTALFPNASYEIGEILQPVTPDDREAFGLRGLKVHGIEYSVNDGAWNDLPSSEMVDPSPCLACRFMIDSLEGVHGAV